MVAPVTGPFTKVESFGPIFGNTGSNKAGSRSRTWYRQKAPYRLPLKFSYRHQEIVSWSTNEPGLYTVSTSSLPDAPGDVVPNVYNAAYSKFKGALGTAAELSVTVAERKQAIEMIHKRSLQLLRFVSSLKKLHFKDAANALGVKSPPIRSVRRIRKEDKIAIWNDSIESVASAGRRGKSVIDRRKTRGLDPRKGSKSFANNYLEFHFGWSPLVKDIGNAIEVLQGGCPPTLVRGRSKSKFNTRLNLGWEGWTLTRELEQTVTLQAKVRITNPDIWLANQMGFVNPLKVAWELVPYSFVVDWFVNVSDYLGACTDFLGVDLIDPITTVFTSATTKGSYLMKYPGSTIVKNGSKKSIHVSRTLGIAGPSLRVRPPWTMSPRRGLAAISLLLQKM